MPSKQAAPGAETLPEHVQDREKQSQKHGSTDHNGRRALKKLNKKTCRDLWSRITLKKREAHDA